MEYRHGPSLKKGLAGQDPMDKNDHRLNQREPDHSAGFLSRQPVPQLSWFHNLPHSSTTARKSPLCFQTLTKPSFCNPSLLIFIQKHRGCTPQIEKTANPNPLNKSLLHTSIAGTNIAMRFMN